MLSTEQGPQHVAYAPQAVAYNAMPAVASAHQHSRGFDPHQLKVMKVLAGFQIAIGISCVVIQAIFIPIQRSYIYYADYVGAGIWCGAFFILAGSLGIAAAWKNTMSLIVSTMVVSIISSVTLWVAVGIASGSISRSVDFAQRPCDRNRYGYDDYIKIVCTYPNFAGYKAADSILLILSVAEFVVSVWSAVLCCKASCRACCICCCYGSDYSYHSPAIYYATAQAGGPRLIVLPQSNIPGDQVIGVMSAEQGYSIGQQQVMFCHPAYAPAYGQPGTSIPPGYSAAQADGSAVCQSGELTKEQMAAGN